MKKNIKEGKPVFGNDNPLLPGNLKKGQKYLHKDGKIVTFTGERNKDDFKVTYEFSVNGRGNYGLTHDEVLDNITLLESKRNLTKEGLQKLIKSTIKELHNTDTQVKIKQVDGRWRICQTDTDHYLDNNGYETKELAQHAALTKGYSYSGVEEELPDTVEVPKPTKREKPKGTNKPEELKLGKETEQKLESIIKRVIKEEVRKKYRQFKNGEWMEFRRDSDNGLIGKVRMEDSPVGLRLPNSGMIKLAAGVSKPYRDKLHLHDLLQNIIGESIQVRKNSRLNESPSPLIRQLQQTKGKRKYYENDPVYKKLETIAEDSDEWEIWINLAAKHGIDVKYDNNDDCFIVTNSVRESIEKKKLTELEVTDPEIVKQIEELAQISDEMDRLNNQLAQLKKRAAPLDEAITKLMEENEAMGDRALETQKVLVTVKKKGYEAESVKWKEFYSEFYPKLNKMMRKNADDLLAANTSMKKYAMTIAVQYKQQEGIIKEDNVISRLINKVKSYFNSLFAKIDARGVLIDKGIDALKKTL